MTRFILGMLLGGVLTGGLVLGSDFYNRERNRILKENNRLLQQQQEQQLEQLRQFNMQTYG